MRIDPRRLFQILPIALAWVSTEARADYRVTNLVSDIAGLAANTDTNLKNPWGVSFSPTGPFWVSDQASNKATLYTSAGSRLGLVVSIPTSTTPPNGPTGQVWNGNANDFRLNNGAAAHFLFANLNGQISAWNGGTVAEVKVNAPSSVYTGLAIAQFGTDNILYAADARNGKIDVYDSFFGNLNNSTFSGKFQDANLAAGFTVYNVQTIGSNVYVTYESRTNPVSGGGAVAVFDLAGNLIRDFSNGAGGPLQDPWGVTISPTSFGQFGGALLIGNNEAGTINAFDATTGAFLGAVATITNDPTSANNGLWALTFGNGGNGGDRNTLYAFAGINNEADGLIAAVTAVPEPGSAVLVALGGGSALAASRLRRGSRRD